MSAFGGSLICESLIGKVPPFHVEGTKADVAGVAYQPAMLSQP
jgi:uncharacterized membrane protein YeiH